MRWVDFMQSLQSSFEWHLLILYEKRFSPNATCEPHVLSGR